jgi:hypothetical protein
MKNVSRAVLTALSLAAGAVSAQPDLEGFWTPSFVPPPEGQVLVDKLPPGAIMIDDAGGGELGEGEYGGLQLTDRAKAEVAAYDYSVELSSEYACTPPSVAFYMQAPFPMEIYQDNKLIVFKMEYFDMVRIIFLDGREHPPADAPHSKNGHSTGHWEGEELVVDTTHIESGTFMNNGFNHSNNLHLTERFRLSSDGSTLFVTQVSEDPETFSGLAARYFAFRKVAGEFVYPYECDPSFGQ